MAIGISAYLWSDDTFQSLIKPYFQVRPDNIVTESDFFNTWKKFKDDPSHLAINITKRTRWDDGLDRGENPDEGWCNIYILEFILTNAM